MLCPRCRKYAKQGLHPACLEADRKDRTEPLYAAIRALAEELPDPTQVTTPVANLIHLVLRDLHKENAHQCPSRKS